MGMISAYLRQPLKPCPLYLRGDKVGEDTVIDVAWAKDHWRYHIVGTGGVYVIGRPFLFDDFSALARELNREDCI
jgi:hypothetical protein